MVTKKNTHKKLFALLSAKSGQGLIEYALNIFFIAVTLIATLVLFRGSLIGFYADIVNLLNAI